MAAWYFEEILLDLKKTKKTMEELIKPIECSDVLVECEYFAGVSVNVELLKCLKSRLESEWHPRVPWPRYSRKLTFQHSRPHPLSY